MAISRFTGVFGFLSNFHPSPIEEDGIVYPTVEHYFQAMKSLDKEERIKISKLGTPTEAKRYGRRVKLRPDWEDIKLCVMEQRLRKKFQNPEFRNRLLATGKKQLVKGNSWGDVYWGVCNSRGQNNLGKLLMKIREEL